MLEDDVLLDVMIWMGLVWLIWKWWSWIVGG